MPERADREREFHDALYTQHTRVSVDVYYPLLTASADFYADLIRAHCHAKRVLEYGCGEGSLAISVALRGAVVDAIDISPVALDTARATARAQNAPVRFRLMNAETLDYPDNTFDLICGRSILHHLNLGRAFREITRTLKPDGKAVFLEPLGHNPLLNLVRRLTPQMRSRDERPLRMTDIRAAHQNFGVVEARFLHLSSLLGLPLRRAPGVRFLIRALDSLDKVLFTTWLKRYAWIVVLSFEQPLKSSRAAAAAP